MTKLKINSWLLLFIWSFSYAQISEYSYKRELQGITEKWHTIELPNELFGKVKSNLSDIRIYGVTAANDTIEAPYLLRVSNEKYVSKEVNFRMINRSNTNRGYYFTFRIPSKEPINQIQLDFNQDNFDWKVRLEGSHDQQKWYGILDNYRVLSIKNEQTNYQFTRINFPDSNYRYFRLFINSKQQPDLKTAKLTFETFSDASIVNYTIQKVGIQEKKASKQTTVDVDLEKTVPVSMLIFNIEASFEYYRPISIKYVTDSVQTEQGWYYNYRTLSSGTLSSLEKNIFKFNSTILQKLKIIIYNNDNEPLKINTIAVKGYNHELIARFTTPASYYLTYGNLNDNKPTYDLNHLTNNIPDAMTKVSLKNEQRIDKKEVPTREPLFKNKNWLWALMVLIILVLGWFSLRMMRKD